MDCREPRTQRGTDFTWGPSALSTPCSPVCLTIFKPPAPSRQHLTGAQGLKTNFQNKVVREWKMLSTPCCGDKCRFGCCFCEFLLCLHSSLPASVLGDSLSWRDAINSPGQPSASEIFRLGPLKIQDSLPSVFC